MDEETYHVATYAETRTPIVRSSPLWVLVPSFIKARLPREQVSLEPRGLEFGGHAREAAERRAALLARKQSKSNLVFKVEPDSQLL